MEQEKTFPQSHVQEVASDGEKQGFGAKLKAHLRRYWWLHLIFFIASTLIIVLCLIYVAFPRIAQDGVNKATLEIQSLTLSNPTPTSFHLSQTAKLTNHNKYHPRLDAFNASLSVGGAEEDKPFAYIQLPAVHATETTYTHVDQDVQIIDMPAFIEYNTQLLTRDSVDLIVKGKTKLHEMRFPVTTVDFQKTINMKGLNNLAGFNITSFTILLTPEPDGTNMRGEISIPNPSVLTISMGNVTFSNYIDGIFIGTSSLANLVVQPGDNTVSMRSTVNQSFVMQQVLGGRYKDGMVPVDIRGDSSVFEGERVEYFEMALRANWVRVVLDVGRALREVGGGGK
ncbi:MAG: hypothetical protein Q9186_004900 [Xanthomendoza sp. 1 TL-2023]